MLFEISSFYSCLFSCGISIPIANAFTPNIQHAVINIKIRSVVIRSLAGSVTFRQFHREKEESRRFVHKKKILKRPLPLVFLPNFHWWLAREAASFYQGIIDNPRSPPPI